MEKILDIPEVKDIILSLLQKEGIGIEKEDLIIHEGYDIVTMSTYLCVSYFTTSVRIKLGALELSWLHGKNRNLSIFSEKVLIPIANFLISVLKR